MPLERIEIECTGSVYVGEAEIVLPGQGARRHRFREATCAAIWEAIERWLGEMSGVSAKAAEVPRIVPDARPKLTLAKPAK